MHQPLFGSILLIICIFLFWSAWLKAKQEKANIAVLLIILAGLLLRIYTATDGNLHPWDERFHALVAKNLIAHPLIPTLYENPVLPYDYKGWGSNHIWLHKQPLPLWAMALSLKLFGISAFAVRIPSLLISTLAIWLTFQIGRYLFNRKIGLLAAGLHAIHGLIIELTAGRVATDHIDIFFLFFIELGVLAAIISLDDRKKWALVLTGVSIGCAILTKWLPALIVLPIWCLLYLDRKGFQRKMVLDLLIIMIACTVVALPWQLYIHHTFPLEAVWESKYNVLHIVEGLGGHDEPFYYHLNVIRMIYGELIYLPLLWLLWVIVNNRFKKFRWIAIACWIWVPLAFFSVVRTKMPGYTIFSAPAYFLLTAFFVRYLRLLSIKFKNDYLKKLILLVMFLLIALPVRYAVERVKPFSEQERNPEWVTKIKAFGDRVKDMEKVLVFNTKRPIAMMFYTDVYAAYETLPEDGRLNAFLEEGFLVYIESHDGTLYEYSSAPE